MIRRVWSLCFAVVFILCAGAGLCADLPNKEPALLMKDVTEVGTVTGLYDSGVTISAVCEWNELTNSAKVCGAQFRIVQWMGSRAATSVLFVDSGELAACLASLQYMEKVAASSILGREITYRSRRGLRIVYGLYQSEYCLTIYGTSSDAATALIQPIFISRVGELVNKVREMLPELAAR